jgi:signal transduction histidine kinase
MDKELKRLRLGNDSDILLAHHLALQLAGKGGVSILEQLNYAGLVTQHCLLAYVYQDEIIFSLRRQDDRYILCAITQQDLYSIEIDVPRDINIADIPLIPGYIEETKLQQEESYRDMQQFTLALSHELKNSIAKIKLAVSLVELEEMLPAVDTYVKIIHRASDRLERTMLNLNEIIRLRHLSGIAKKIAPINIFEDVKEEFSEALCGIDNTLNTHFSGVDEMNYVETYLRSIFSNVISNAIKYSHPGRPLRLLVKGRKTNSHTIFSFTDNGQGIDLSLYREKLFEPFSRFSSHAQGSGLGLYLIKTMVERNGGKIEVTSKPGEGTTFHFFLKEY